MASNSKDDDPSKATPIMNTGVATHPQATTEANIHFHHLSVLSRPIFSTISSRREGVIAVGRQKSK